MFSRKRGDKFDTIAMLIEHTRLCSNVLYLRLNTYIEYSFDKYHKLFVPRIGK